MALTFKFTMHWVQAIGSLLLSRAAKVSCALFASALAQAEAEDFLRQLLLHGAVLAAVARQRFQLYNCRQIFCPMCFIPMWGSAGLVEIRDLLAQAVRNLL